MSLFQRMSNRDRSLIILLLTVVIFYLCYTFVMKPAMASAEVLKTNLADVEQQLQQASELSGKTDDLKAQEKKMRAELVDKYSVFLFSLDQTRLLNKIDALMIGSGLPADSYVPSPEMANQVPVEIGAYEPLNYPLKEMALKINPSLTDGQVTGGQTGSASQTPANSSDVAATSDMIPGTDVSVGFKGASYESIYNFIASVENMKKTIVVKSIDVNKDETGLTGQITFSFYSLPKLDPEQKDGLDYVPAIPAGKANPFL